MIDVKTIGSIALRAVKANKLRSTLTSLGIIIGVAAVIVMLAVGNGAQISIQQDMQAMGSNLIIVRSGVATSSGARGGHGSQPTMRLSDGNAIQEKIDAIVYAAPVMEETASRLSPLLLRIFFKFSPMGKISFISFPFSRCTDGKILYNEQEKYN